MARQQFGSALGNLGELALKGFNNAGMKSASRLTQKGAVGRVLDESMFKKIGRVRRHTLPEKQTCRHETVECRLKFRLRLANHGPQERMRELSPYYCTDLGDFFR